MENVKKFTIPSIDDILKENDEISVRHHFQPGSIISEENSTITRSTIADNTHESTEGTNVSRENKELSSTNDPSKVKTAFEIAFNSLKDSKYYEKIEKDVLCKETSAEKVTLPAKIKSIVVNPKQKGNPLLKHIRNVPWEFGEIEPDYLVGQTTCVLFLSIKYHSLFPNYIHDRLKSLGKGYQLRVLLVQLDMSDPYPAVRELSSIAILTDFTLMCAWSAEEAGRYLETYKIFENKSPELIMERQEDDVCSKVVNALSSVKSINQTDALTLLTTFGSLEKVVGAKPEDLILCPGMGQNKANKLYEIFHQPFLKPEKKPIPS